MSQQTMYPGIANSPQTELAAAIDDSQTTISLVDASLVPPAPNIATIGSDETAETVLYTGKTGNDITGVSRGFEGTAKSWSVGMKVARNFTNRDYEALTNNIGDLVAGFDDLAGAGRTTETVKGNADAITAHLAETVSGLYNAKYNGLALDGSTDDYAAFSALLTSIGSDKATIMIPPGTVKLSSNITIPENVTLWLVRGAMLSPDTGITVTVNGGIDAGVYQIFAGGGAVAGSPRIPEAYPEWFGAKADYPLTDDSQAFAKLIAFASGSAGIQMTLPGINYKIGTVNALIIGNSNLKMKGKGNTNLWYTPATGACLTISAGVKGCVFEDFNVVSLYTDTVPDISKIGINCAGNNNKFYNVKVYSAGSGANLGFYYGIQIGQWSNRFLMCQASAYYRGFYSNLANFVSLVQCNASAQGQAGIMLAQGSGNSITDCNIEGTAQHNILIHSNGAGSGGHGTNAITGCYMEGATNGNIWINGAAGMPLKGISIRGNFMQNGPTGIKLNYAEAVSIDSNYIFGVADGIRIDAGCTLLNVGVNQINATGNKVVIGTVPTASMVWDGSRIRNFGMPVQQQATTLPAGTTSIDFNVYGNVVFTANTAATTISAITNMNDGTTITIVAGDVNTTITAGGNWSMPSNWSSNTSKVITFVKKGTTWIEVSRY